MEKLQWLFFIEQKIKKPVQHHVILLMAEIRRSPVEICFQHHPRWLARFQPSTVPKLALPF